MPFYVLAARDAHIVFSPVETPNWTRDNVYEICELIYLLLLLLLFIQNMYARFILYISFEIQWQNVMTRAARLSISISPEFY